MVYFKYQQCSPDFRDGQNGEPEVAEPGSAAQAASGTVYISIQAKRITANCCHSGYKYLIYHGEAKGCTAHAMRSQY